MFLCELAPAFSLSLLSFLHITFFAAVVEEGGNERQKTNASFEILCMSWGNNACQRGDSTFFSAGSADHCRSSGAPKALKGCSAEGAGRATGKGRGTVEKQGDG